MNILLRDDVEKIKVIEDEKTIGEIIRGGDGKPVKVGNVTKTGDTIKTFYKDGKIETWHLFPKAFAAQRIVRQLSESKLTEDPQAPAIRAKMKSPNVFVHRETGQTWLSRGFNVRGERVMKSAAGAMKAFGKDEFGRTFTT